MNASNFSSKGMTHDEIAFPLLNAAEIHVAEKFGRRERLEAGRVLFAPGQQLVELFVILDGSLEVIDTSGEQERILAVHGTRGFVGEISLLTGRKTTSLCRVESAAEVIRIPVDALRRFLVSSASFAEKWMNSLLRRREVLLARGRRWLTCLRCPCGCRDASITRVYPRERLGKIVIDDAWKEMR